MICFQLKENCDIRQFAFLELVQVMNNAE